MKWKWRKQKMNKKMESVVKEVLTARDKLLSATSALRGLIQELERPLLDLRHLDKSERLPFLSVYGGGYNVTSDTIHFLIKATKELRNNTTMVQTNIDEISGRLDFFRRFIQPDEEK